MMLQIPDAFTADILIYSWFQFHCLLKFYCPCLCTYKFCLFMLLFYREEMLFMLKDDILINHVFCGGK